MHYTRLLPSITTSYHSVLFCLVKFHFYNLGVWTLPKIASVHHAWLDQFAASVKLKKLKLSSEGVWQQEMKSGCGVDWRILRLTGESKVRSQMGVFVLNNQDTVQQFQFRHRKLIRNRTHKIF
jgi:hypothetical protein